jgi:DNA polymerase-1
MFESDNNITQSNIQECIDYCKTKHLIAIDTETEGLDFTVLKMLMLQIGDEDQQFVIDVRDTDIEPLKVIFEDNSIVKVFHNAKFDYKFLKNYNINTNNIYDTYLIEKILYCGDMLKGYSLKSLLKRYLNIEISKAERSTFNVNMKSLPFTHSQIKYGADDVKHLIKIKQLQEKELAIKDLVEVGKLENLVVKVFSEIEYQGLDIDRKAWDMLAHNNKQRSYELQLELDNAIINHPKLKTKYRVPVQQDLFKPVEEIRKTNINWDSPKQMLELFKRLFPSLDDVNGKKLLKYSHNELVKLYLKYKEVSKLASTYGESFYEHTKKNNRIHTDFNQILNTGRISSSNPNMQQIPSNNSYRNCFIAPEGYVFVSSDYSSQELNVLAYWSNDPVFLQALQNNEDLHSVCAELIFDDWTDKKEANCMYNVNKSKCDCKQHKIYRNKAKSVNFGLSYGMGPHKLSDQLDIPLNEASDLITKFFDAFPNIKRFLDQRGKFGKQNGYITTLPPFKRKRFFPEWSSDYTPPKDLGVIERASKNTSIQGSSADMLKLALHYIYKYIDDNNLHNDIKIVMTVHDQIDTICKKELSAEWVKKLEELMEDAANVIIKNKLLKAESFISERWSK